MLAMIGSFHMGSSPRMRGTLEAHKSTPFWTGIIPAYAGNTDLHSLLIGQIGDHPRVCGEHLREIGSETPQMGSSPRMRGTHLHGLSDSVHHGIIPAYAGNTNERKKPLERRKDHPRVCGEHCEHTHKRGVSEGSSPRMRGTHTSHAIHQRTNGIIPAYAGNTFARVRM